MAAKFYITLIWHYYIISILKIQVFFLKNLLFFTFYFWLFYAKNYILVFLYVYYLIFWLFLIDFNQNLTNYIKNLRKIELNYDLFY